jgi:hypothetical protein
MEDLEERCTLTIDYLVNGKAVSFHGDVVTGREALTCSGNVPASEYQLILVHDRRTHLIGTDDEVNLHNNQGGFLRAFQSDRDYAFTVDEVGQVWGTVDMEVDEFLAIWPPRPGHDWILEREDEPDTVLVPGGLLSFGPQGVEHITSRRNEHADKVLVTVVTTSGTFPAEGAKRYPASTPIAHVLAAAAQKLQITDSQGWVVTVAGRDVSPTQTFPQAGLSGDIALEWGPPEGGGGA